VNRPTIKDVARSANVSLKTVSRVINNEPSVREDTRERVQRAIDALNYQPDQAARNLRSATSHSLGLVYDNPNPYYVISVQNGVLAACRARGIPVTAYGVLGRGLIGGSRPSGAGDFRAHTPRFMGENLARNAALAEALAAAASRFGATPAQAAIAWVLAQGADILPLVGARRPDRLAEAIGTLALDLPPAAIAAFEAAIPAGAAAGDRYAAEQMAMLDSERPAAP